MEMYQRVKEIKVGSSEVKIRPLMDGNKIIDKVFKRMR